MIQRRFRFALHLAAVVGLIALVAPVPAVRAAAPASAPALNIANFDTTCKACDDFWRYATGGWRSRTKIPPGYPDWGSFEEIYERNLHVLHGILDNAASGNATNADPDRARVGRFYAACNDRRAIDANGLAALGPELHRIAAITSSAALIAEIARLDRLGVDNGLGFSSEADTRDSSRTIAAVGYGGLGMPDRDYYLLPQKASIRAAYLRYLVAQLTNLGESPAVAQRDSRAIVALETALARATPPDADLRDPLATYHPTRVAKLPALAPHIAWQPFFASFGTTGLQSVDVNVPQYTRVFDRQVHSMSLDTWKAFLRTHVVTAFAAALPQRFEQAQFLFYGRTLEGTREPLARWKRCVAATNRQLGDPLGKVYVAQAFPPAAKARAQQLVANLQTALRSDISTLAWMSPPTRREAQVKLAAYSKKIGYPDRWTDYSQVTFASHDPYIADLFKTRAFAQQRDLARIDKPTDRSLWGMSPPTVNAYYNPSNNEIVFPAGILQPPFFDATADDAVIYGAIGAVIGHEMTHGFDDQGRQYDARGNLRDWWTKSDAVHFKARAQCIIDQFNGYTVEKGLHENGRLVTGEAIADLGGTTIAYRAFTQTAQFQNGQKIDGYTPQQRFFLSYAQAWRDLSTPEYARQSVFDPHPQNRYRLVGTVGNMPEFAAAFHCPLTARMVRPKRCQIW